MEFVRRHQVLVLGIGLPLLFGLVLLWLARQPKVDPRLAAIRMKGYPATLAELDSWYPAVPPEQNAALICERAFTNKFFASEGKEADWLSDRSLQTALGEPLSQEAKELLAAELKNCADTLAILHSIPQDAPSRYSLDLRQGFVLLLPHLAKIKRSVLLLGTEARWHSANGDTDKALDAIEAAGRVSDTLRQEPIFISYLVRVACWNLTLNHLERLLSECPLTDRQLEKVDALLVRAQDEKGLCRALAGERGFGLGLFDDRTNTASLFGGGPGTAARSGNMWKSSALVSLFKATGFFAKDRAFYLDALSNTVSAAELPFPNRAQVMRQMTFTAPPSKLYIVSRMILPALSSPYLRDADESARLRSARAVVRVERYRNAHGGAVPPDLVSAAGSDPALSDPYTGKPLCYLKLERGYLVYSVGTDLRDDQGGGVGDHERRNNNSNTKKSPTDVGLKVAR